MVTTDERQTTAERYGRAATGGGSLRVQEIRAGDCDLLIAAGWCGDKLGTLLYRLVAEYDSVRGEADLYEAEARRLMAVQSDLAKRRDRARKERRTEDADKLSEQAEAAAREISRELTTGRAMVLMKIKSLHGTKEALGRFALIHAVDRKYALDAQTILTLTGRVLDTFLAPTCNYCDGRGFTGGSHRGEQQTLCKPCRGAGHRRDDIGHTDAERRFAGSLAVEMSCKLADTERSMRQFLRSIA